MQGVRPTYVRRVDMRAVPSKFYYFSTESYSKGLPCEARFLKNLRATTNPAREVILVECSRHIPAYRSKYLVLIPRHQGATFVDLHESEPVFAHVLDGSDFLDATEIDLSTASQLSIDIGGISLSLPNAKIWQLSEEEDADSAEFERRLNSGEL